MMLISVNLDTPKPEHKSRSFGQFLANAQVCMCVLIGNLIKLQYVLVVTTCTRSLSFEGELRISSPKAWPSQTNV